MGIDPQKYREAMRQWTAGVTVVTTKLPDGQLHGMTASSFTSVSLEPVLVLICVGKDKFMHSQILQAQSFAVNILSATQSDWGMRFAGMQPEIEDRFADISYTTAETGAPILPEVSAWVDCKLHTVHDAGDHSIFIGEVLDAAASNNNPPLLYYERQWGTFSAQ